jgi:2-polyprenyl-6-methoxyphenol hydroxylase-like FAD-dependent oxidoreductase
VKFDVIVVGARCAGAATALLLARSGARVLVLEKDRYGTDTQSTHALMRGAVLQLRRWGLLSSIAAAGTPPIRSSTFSYADHDVTVAIEPKFGVGALYAPRRTLLDRVLADAAADAGAELRYRCDVRDVLFDAEGRAAGLLVLRDGKTERVDADLVIGADGRRSTIARRVGAATRREARHSTGVLYSYWEKLDVQEYYWGYRPQASVGLIPTNHNATCVFVSAPWPRFRTEMAVSARQAYERLIRDAFPALDARLRDASRIEPVRGFGGQLGFMKQSSGPGWALVGDAAYFKDPLTAHGITDAFRDAELVARAAVRGTPQAFADYEAVRTDLSDKLFDLTDEIVSFEWTDAQLQSLHRALSAEMSREARALEALEPFPAILPSRREGLAV